MKYFIIILCFITSNTLAVYSNNTAPTSVNQAISIENSTNSRLNWRQFFNEPYLNKLIDTALVRNSNLQLAIQQLEIANNYFQMTKGALWPSLGLGANYIPSNGWYQSNPSQGYGVYLSSTWEIDLWGKLKNKKNAAKKRFLASEQGVKMVKTALISELAKAYFELIFLDQELIATDKNIQLQSNALEIVKVQKEAGKATNLAVLQFEAQLLSSKTKKFEIERQIIHIENIVNLLLNRGYQPIVREKMVNFSFSSRITLKEIPSSEIANRPDIAEANLQLEAAGFDVKVAQKAFYPSIVIQPNIGLLSDIPTQLLNPIGLSWSILGQLTAPIFQNNMLKGQLKIKKAEQKQALVNYQQKLYKGYAEVSENISKIESIQNEILLLKNQVAVLDSAVANSHDLYIYGYANYLEVINTQKSVQEAEIKLILTEKEECQLWIDLFRSLGGSK